MELAYIKNFIRIAVKTPNQYKKICKFFFTKKDTSLYISFNFKGRRYHYGVKTFPPGVPKLSFNFTKGGQYTPKAPKLSYHESGEVHFKLNTDRETREKVSATPIDKLDNTHIITIIANTLEGFEDVEKEDKVPYATVDFSEKIESVKLTVWGSLNEAIMKKYPFGFGLGRVSKPIVFFGIKFESQSSISQGEPGLTVITGWDISAVDISKPTTLLYLQGTI